MATVSAKIEELVDRFDQNKDPYKSPSYNETELRVELVNPFWSALGWDVDNRSGQPMAFRDVIHEDAIKIGGSTKAPDYCFRIGAARKFFVETKKPALNIKDDPSPAYQVRRYAWTAKLPLSVLTDFEEFAVYEGRVRPKENDNPSRARTHYIKYTDYIGKWDDIASIFSREAVSNGSLEKYAESRKGRRGSTEVDAELLKDIERWRELLARNIAVRNPALSVREINYAVQATIDRIIFLRMGEDRGIEPYQQLRALTAGPNIYPRLLETFRRADDNYNSGLFHFTNENGRPGTPDELTPGLQIDDKVFKDILSHLYYPESPYEFSVMPPEILGNVYEQFLGKVIRLTKGHRAKVEEKPEVRKAGGVYYTPKYIVDYIVQNTVGKLCKGKTPKQIENLRVLDPACGSGSFLLGAYQYLLDHHLKWYTDNPAKRPKRKPAVYEGRGGQWLLTTAEKKRILTNNIYGVDIDPQAVEVTKLSLLLRVLENESQDSLESQLKLFGERALPDLADNIKCGNSLIAPDFYQGSQGGLFDEEEHHRINAFDWKAEFPEIMKGGGFDAVIGNPPWGAEFTDQELEYHRQKNSRIIKRMIDSFMYFVYQSSQKLGQNGFLGMILPDVLLYQGDNQYLRNYISTEFKILKLINLGDVFDKVTRPAAIVIFQNITFKHSDIAIFDISSIKKEDKSFAICNTSNVDSISQDTITSIPGALFITSNPDYYPILKKAKNLSVTSLNKLTDKDGIQRGVSPDLKKAFIVTDKIVRQRNLENEKLRSVLTGGEQVKRYFINHADLQVIYTTRDDNFNNIPNICSYINQFKNEITCKEVKTNKHPLYSLHRPRKEEIFLKENKLLGVITGDRIILANDNNNTFATDGLYLFSIEPPTNYKYIMGIMNSRVFVFLYRLLSIEKGRVLAQVKPTILNQLPIRTIDFSNSSDEDKHDRIVSLVETMLDLHKKLPDARTPQGKTLIERQIEAADRGIDALVYELYGLTDEEIRIVEEASGK